MSDRSPDYVSNRVLLCNASIDVIKDKYEAECLHEYKMIADKVYDAYQEIQQLSKQPNTASSIKKIESQIVQYDIQLAKMESAYPLQGVIQRMRGKEEARQVEHKQPEKATKSNRPRKKKSVIKALNRLYDEGVFTALTYIITFLWFGYLVNIVAKADSHIIGKIFFIVWSLVLAFLFVIHKFGGRDDD
jgi:hypothetical protein